MTIAAAPASALLLECVIGDARSADAPATWHVALWDADPRLGGSAELTSAGGYARAALSNASSGWASLSSVATSQPVAFPQPTGAWSAAGLWLSLHVSVTDPVPYFPQQLDTPVVVSSASDPAPQVQVTCCFAYPGIS
ncbi:MAG TPA: hypothetical protein VN088_16270 [Nocardioides sp.]|nr:hypothetical protein [Nocardioides sp.]